MNNKYSLSLKDLSAREPIYFTYELSKDECLSLPYEIITNPIVLNVKVVPYVENESSYIVELVLSNDGIEIKQDDGEIIIHKLKTSDYLTLDSKGEETDVPYEYGAFDLEEVIRAIFFQEMPHKLQGNYRVTCEGFEIISEEEYYKRKESNNPFKDLLDDED